MNFMEVLLVVFVVLKLCGLIAWSWWLVTLPLWGGIALWGGDSSFNLEFRTIKVVS